MKTFFIKTFGCQMNKSDSEKIAGLMVKNGYSKAKSIDEADVALFNTCCVRKNAENKFYGQLLAIKSKNNRLVVVSGCLAQREKEKLINRGADIVLGPQNIEQLPELLFKRPVAAFKDTPDIFQAELPEVREKSFSSWLPVITGCNNFCSYCAVPYVRGREKSLPLEKAVQVAKKAVDSGAVEITLLGQNVNSYGNDIHKKACFDELLDNISKIDGLKRIRFYTSHPKDLTEEIINVVAEKNNICKHIHLPVQSGSTKILKAMGRGYSKEDYLRLVGQIRKNISDVSITTDIMVGFPGETEKDFEDTLEVVNKSKFESAFMFIYSPRPGTKSFPLDELDHPVTSKRFSRLLKKVEELGLESNKKFEGRKVNVLVEGASKRDSSIQTGRTDCNRLVHFKAENIKPGDFVDIKINRALSWYLLGEQGA